MEVILYSKECNWYTRCCPLNGGVRYRECPLREAILYMYMYIILNVLLSLFCVSIYLQGVVKIMMSYIEMSSHWLIIYQFIIN